jgi:methionyl-tRNA formyltransferase
MAGAPLARRENDVPTFQVGKLASPPTIELITSLEPDVIVVACFPRLIPGVVREIARHAAINVHPSLLPVHRGPDPLFWIMRDGVQGCGVTVHALSDNLDAGDILAQQAVPYPDGAREHDLELLLASVGADLVVSVVDALRTGESPRQRQDEHTSTYESWPDTDDFVISSDRPVRDAWNFVRGVAGRGVPVRVDTGAADLSIIDAHEVVLGHRPPVPTNADEIAIRFSDGWLLARKNPASVD